MSSSSEPDQRKLLRQQLRQRRRSLSPEQQQQAAAAVCRNLLALPCFVRAQKIALYLAADGEVATDLIAGQAWRDGKQVYVPVVDAQQQGQMRFQLLLPQQQCVNNRYAISEPLWQPQQQLDCALLDVVLLPLVGFDAAGGRLGMGGGYYDRALAQVEPGRPALIGLAHSCQQLPQLEVQPWDVPLDAVITEQGSLVFSQKFIE